MIFPRLCISNSEYSTAYLALLQEALQTPTNLTEDHLNALRRLDSSGPIPFLQEGLLADGKPGEAEG